MNNVIIVYHSIIINRSNWRFFQLLLLLLFFPLFDESMDCIRNTSILEHDGEVKKVGDEEDHALIPKYNAVPGHSHKKRDGADIEKDVPRYWPPLHFYRLKENKNLVTTGTGVLVILNVNFFIEKA